MTDNNFTAGAGAVAPNQGADNSSLIAELDDKLGMIEKRLAEISSYQSTTPATAQEKESLSRRKDILIATRNRLAGESGQATDVSSPSQSSPAATSKPAEYQPEKAAPAAPPFRFPDLSPPFKVADKPAANRVETDKKGPAEGKEEDGDEAEYNKAVEQAEEEIGDGLIGQNYAVPYESKNNNGKESDYQKNDAEEETEKTSSLQNEFELDERTVASKLGKVSLVKIFNKVDQAIDLFGQTLKSNNNHPDNEYLSRTLETLKKAVDNLRKKSEQVDMNDGQLKQAVLGRVSGYFGLVQNEFDLSGLLDKEVETQVKKLLEGGN